MPHGLGVPATATRTETSRVSSAWPGPGSPGRGRWGARAPRGSWTPLAGGPEGSGNPLTGTEGWNRTDAILPADDSTEII